MKAWLARAASWLKVLGRWLAEARLAWVALGVVLLALTFSLWSGVTELQIRLTGLLLQLLGIGTVAHGVHQTRKLFGRPGVLDLLRKWLSRFPRWRRQVIVGVGGSSVGISGGLVRAHIWTKIDPASPIQVQLDGLKQNVERLNERLIQTQNELDAQLGQHSEALRQEQQVRAKDDTELRQRLEVAETGGLHITFIGVVWLFLGVLLATIAPEISRWRS